MESHPRQLESPLLFLAKDWNHVSVKAYHEPDVMSYWADPVIDEISLVWMARGTMLMEGVGHDRMQFVRQGDWFLKPAAAESAVISWKNLSPVPMQTLHIHLNNNFFLNIASESKLRTLPRLLMQTAFQDPLLAQIGLALWRELESPSSLGDLYAETAAQMLSVHLLRHYAAATLPTLPQGLNQKQVAEVKDFIQDNLSAPLSLEMMAQLVDLSPYHFARMFRQATGQSPYQFVVRQRVEHAKHLLMQTKMPLAEIALESGFAHQSHFNQVFKRYLGVSPRAYRQRR